MPTALFIFPGPQPPPENPARDKLFYLPAEFKGYALLASWGSAKEYPSDKTTGNFNYFFSFPGNGPALFTALRRILFFIRKGLHLHRNRNPIDVIITYGSNSTGLAGAVLKLLTGAKLIVEIPGVPHQAYVLVTKKWRLSNALKRTVSLFVLRAVLLVADVAKLLYPDQLAHVSMLPSVKREVFFDFIALSACKPSDVDDGSILFVGNHWHLKGLDLLINAFKAVANDFPDSKLIIVGWEPHPQFYYKLAGEDSRIIFTGPKPAFEYMQACSCLVLPSRTEAMGRVILEAMASKKPVIGSRIDGIKHYVQHEKTGFLFEPENQEQLSGYLRRILTDENERKELGANALNFSREHYSERVYGARLAQMLNRACVK